MLQPAALGPERAPIQESCGLLSMGPMDSRISLFLNVSCQYVSIATFHVFRKNILFWLSVVKLKVWRLDLGSGVMKTCSVWGVAAPPDRPPSAPGHSPCHSLSHIWLPYLFIEQPDLQRCLSLESCCVGCRVLVGSHCLLLKAGHGVCVPL